VKEPLHGKCAVGWGEGAAAAIAGRCA